MWFFTRMPSHMYNQHVLRLEWLLLTDAVRPFTDELLALVVDVIVVDVLRIKMA